MKHDFVIIDEYCWFPPNLIEAFMDMKTYNVAYKTPSGIKKIGTVTAFDAEDAKKTIKTMVMIDNNQFFDCTITRVWLPKPPTNKQKLAQKYGFILGSLKGARSEFNFTRMHLVPNGLDTMKVNRATGLVDMQFSKLERDIRDFFKLAGLKIK